MTARSRFTEQSIPVRRRFRVADVSAPGEAAATHASPGAAFSVLSLAVPDSVLALLKIVGAHEGIEDEGEMISRLIEARAEAIGVARLAKPASTETRDSKKGREGMPSGALPLPRAPP